MTSLVRARQPPLRSGAGDADTGPMTSPVTTSTNSAPTSAPVCPNCGSTLQLEHDGELDAWACPQHHGLGFTVSEAYERMDESEIHTIWQQARTASAGSRTCPICTTTMVSVTVAPTPRTRPTHPLSLDVCLVDEFIWFDAGELDEIPVDTNEPVPNPEEDAQIAQITEQFGSELTAGVVGARQRDAARPPAPPSRATRRRQLSSARRSPSKCRLREEWRAVLDEELARVGGADAGGHRREHLDRRATTFDVRVVGAEHQ